MINNKTTLNARKTRAEIIGLFGPTSNSNRQTSIFNLKMKAWSEMFSRMKRWLPLVAHHNLSINNAFNS
jgi:hypothetical protein